MTPATTVRCVSSPVSPVSRRALAAVLLVTTAGLSGCGGDQPSGDPTKAASATESSAPTGDPTEGVDVTGEGYALTVPPGWTDSTDQVKARFDKVDRAAGDTSVVGGFADNVNVIVSDKRRIKTQRKAERILRTDLSQVGKDVQVQEPGDLDGEVAYHATARLKVGRIKVRTTQYFAQHDGAWYLVTFSYGPQTDAETEAAEIQGMLDSWSWKN